jgi:membrane protein DedA with SNARE-associated domain
MTAVIGRYGVLGVFLLMVPESACIPIPSEVTLLFSGYAVHQGWMSFPLAVLAATAGNLVGSLVAYGVGASNLLARVPVVSTMLSRWEGSLERRGNRAVLTARLLPLARTFVSLPAGARRVPLVPFVAMTALGCALWAIAFVLTGLLLGTAWGAVSSLLGRVLLVVGLVVVALSLIRRRNPGDERPWRRFRGRRRSR